MSTARYASLFTLLLLFATSLFATSAVVAQPNAAAEQNRIQIKLTESAKSQLAGPDGALPPTMAVPKADMGQLSQLAQQYQMSRMERVFRPAGKHEARHIEWGLDRWYVVRYSADAAPREVARDFLAANEQVEEASPVYNKERHYRRSSGSAQADPPASDPGQNFVPDDPEYAQQWHYDNTADNTGEPDADINLPEAHDIEGGDESVVISVVDGGLDLDHPEFEGMLWINEEEDINNNGQFDPFPASEGGDLNGVDDDNNGFTDDVIGYDHGGDDPTPSADGDHGTHVAGTVAARNDNGQFVAGVAGGNDSESVIRLMISQTFSPAGVGGFPEAIVYAADNGAVVSQNSWGYTTEGDFEPALLDAIDYFRANAGGPGAPMDGGIFVNSAGNSNSDGEWYPGFYEGSYAVSATNENDSKAGYSNYGDWMDVAAPGGGGSAFGGCGDADDDVLSTVVGGSGRLCGTSMAAPHVSGVIGLVVSANQGLTNDQVEQLLKDTGADVSGNQPERVGPRIDAEAAVASVSGDDTPPAAVTDLAAAQGTSDEPGAAVDLTWTAPGNDGSTGFANAYDIRYSLSGPITDSTSFAAATQVEGEPVPDSAGTSQSYTIQGLPFDSEVHFAIKASDAAGNTSGVSNSPSIVTQTGPVAEFNPSAIETEITVGESTTLTASLANTGTVDFEFTIDEEALPEYLSVSPAQDSLAAGASQEIEFTFDGSDLDLQVFEASVEALVSHGMNSSTATIQTTLDVNTAPYPFAIDTESIEETVDSGEEVTRTVTITNESERSRTFEIFGGAAQSSSVLPTAPFNGEMLVDWKRRRAKRLSGDYEFEGKADPTAQAYDGSSERRHSVTRSDAVIPTTGLTGSATSVFGPLSGNFVDLPVDNPANMAATGPSPTAFAGNYDYGAEDRYFVITDADNKFHEIDRETGEITTLGTAEPQESGETWTEIATDPTTGELYASTSNGAGSNKLYTLDPETGEAVFVTDISSPGLIIAMAIDGNGDMYGLDIVSDALVTIDKESGSVTTVGPVGFDANFAQGMDFDLKTGNLYLAAYEQSFFFNSGSLYQADPTTGETTFLGAPGGGSGAELGYLALPSVGFVEPSLAQGTLPSGSSIEVDLTITGERLNDGTYQSDVIVASNVAGEPQETIDVTMNVDGEPQLAVVPSGDSTIAYDSTFVSDTTAAELVTVRNEGTADLEATLSTGSQFTADTDSLSLFPGEAETVEVRFTPTRTGDFSQALTVETADSTDTVGLEGVSIPAPVAEFSKDSFDVQMYPGQEYTRTLEITNTGGNPLEFVGTEGEPVLPSAVAPPKGAEGFDDGIPSSWATVDEPGEGVTWQTNEDYGDDNYTGSGLAAHVDSDANQDVPYDARLITPEETFTEETVFSFDLNFQVFSGDELFDVDISTDGGSSWSTVQSYEEDTGDFLGEGVSVVIPQDTLAQYVDVGETFQMRFRYYNPEDDAPWDWYAQVDNVAFTPSTEFLAFEPTEGAIAPDSTQEVTFSFNADNLASGTYEVPVEFTTNDPTAETVDVPVTIDVIDQLSVAAEPEIGDDGVVHPNEEFTVPVVVESLDDLAVRSFQFTMNFDGDLVEPTGVVQDSSLSEGLTLSQNLGESSVSISVAEGAEESTEAQPALFDIEGNGALVFVNFRAEEALDTTDMTFPEVLFNEGNPPASGDTTEMEVAPLYGDMNHNLTVTATDAANALDHTVGAIDLSDSQLEAGDVSGNGSTTAFDASLILRRTVGGISCFPAEGGCESGEHVLAAKSGGDGSAETTAALAWGEVTESDASVSRDGKTSEGPVLSLPLVLKQVDGPIQSIQVSTPIDEDKISVDEVTAQLPDDWRTTHDVTDDGVLKIAMAGTSPLGQNGEVATVTLQKEESDAEVTFEGQATVNETSQGKMESRSITSIPDQFALEGAYPNPFDRAATLKMRLPQKATVTVEVYDVLGRKVQTAYNGEMQAGASQTVRINGSGLASGTYFYRATVEMGDSQKVKTGQMTVVQ